MISDAPQVIVAIDPGVSGGIAIYDGSVRCMAMPASQADLVTLLKEVASEANWKALVIIEDIPKFVAGMKTAITSMATLHFNAGFTCGAACALDLRLKKVKPKAWQQAVGAGEKKTYGNRWKAHLKDLAIQRFPNLRKSITLRTADALLILSSALDGSC